MSKENKDQELETDVFIAYENYMIQPDEIGMVIKDKNGIPICKIQKGKDVNNELAGFLLMDHYIEKE